MDNAETEEDCFKLVLKSLSLFSPPLAKKSVTLLKQQPKLDPIRVIEPISGVNTEREPSNIPKYIGNK